MKPKQLILLISVVMFACSQAPTSVPPISMSFQEFKRIYSKTYPNPGIQKYREIVFYNSLNLVNAYNHRVIYDDEVQLGINSYSDLSSLEFSAVASGTVYEDEQMWAHFLNKVKLEEFIKNGVDNVEKRVLENNIQNNRAQVEEKKRREQGRFEELRRRKAENQEKATRIQEQLLRRKITLKEFINDPSQILDAIESNNNLLTPSYDIQNCSPGCSVNSTPFEQMIVPRELLNLGGNPIIPMRLLQTQPQDSPDWSQLSPKITHQGLCNSCWAIATADLLGALLKKSFEIQRYLSSQSLVNCLQNDCEPSYISDALNYSKVLGIPYEFVAEYTGKRNQPCPITPFRFRSRQYRVIQNNCQAIKEALKEGPLIVQIKSRNDGFNFYQRGTYGGCTSGKTDHAVLLVAYSSEKGWKIKNSWGSSWGQGGFGWISEQNDCQICSAAYQMKINTD